MKKSKLYSCTWARQINAGASFLGLAAINLAGKEFFLKSITWDWQTRIDVTQQNVPFANNNTQYINLSILYLAGGTPITSLFENPPIIPLGINGTALMFMSPGKRNYDNFYISNDISIQFNQTNQDVLNVVFTESSVIIEVQEL